MNQPYLEVTYRKGRPLAAYYYLPRRPSDVSVRTRRVEPGLVIDFARGGRPIGIEITTPTKFSLAAFNRVLKSLGLSAASPSTVAPVRAA
jgi:hypothetical protein